MTIFTRDDRSFQVDTRWAIAFYPNEDYPTEAQPDREPFIWFVLKDGSATDMEIPVSEVNCIIP